MSLHFNLTEQKLVDDDLLSANITHNLTNMAEQAGLYKALWHPEKEGYTQAKQIIPILKKGLEDLLENPEKFKRFDSPNGWGTYADFVIFVQQVLECAEDNPNARIEVSI